MARNRDLPDPIPDTTLGTTDVVQALLRGQAVGPERGPANTYTPPTPPTGAPSAAAAAAPVSTVDRVKLLQVKLNELGARPPLKVDGIMGPKTQAAMSQFGLDANGNRTAPPAGGATAAAAGPTGSGSAGSTGQTPAAGSDADVRAQYGAWAWALDIPQVGDILRNAASQGWPTAQVQAAIEQTNWWRTTAASGRQWQERLADDPAEANAEISQKKIDIGQIAAQLGITISDDRLTQMASDVLKFGIDATGLQQMIGNEFHYQPGGQTGSVGVAEGQLKKMAGDYFVPLSDQTLASWETQIAQGRAKPEDFQTYMVNQAKTLYQAPWIQTGLDRGMTTSELADPYRQIAARELEISPDAVDFSQPQWSKPLTTLDKDGQPTGMSLSDWQYQLRTNPVYGFQKTSNARQLAYDAANTLEQGLGKIA